MDSGNLILKDMFYKKENEESWMVGFKVEFPDGEVLNKDNKGSRDGWEWKDEPPEEYLEWKEKIMNPID